MLELPLGRRLARDALDAGPGVPAVHAFVLRRRLREALNPALDALALELEQAGVGMQASPHPPKLSTKMWPINIGTLKCIKQGREVAGGGYTPGTLWELA